MDLGFLIAFIVLCITTKIGQTLVKKIRNLGVEKCLKYAVDRIGECVVAPIRKYMIPGSSGTDLEFLISFTVLYIAARIGKKLLGKIRTPWVEKIRNPVVKKCLKCAMDPIGECVSAPIRKYMVARFRYYLLAPIGCLLYYNRNIGNLRTQLGQLRKIRDEVQGLVNAAERNGEVILPRVQKWQHSLKEITEDLMNLLDSKINLNPMSRYQRSKSAREKTAEVIQLVHKGRSFDRVSTFGSRILIWEQIIEALKDDQTNRIRIWGVAGVGKTTLVKEIYEEAIDDKLFDEVAMATVSSHPNLERIQFEIADMLDLRFFEGGSCIERAHQLSRRLAGKKRILIILDDIWKSVDLETIGIPYDSCKILLVSQSEDLWFESPEKCFPIEALSEDEAWELFRRIVGDSVGSQDLRSKRAEVAETFAGLPRLIMKAARAFKKQGKWSEVLKSIHPPMPSVDEAKSSENIFRGIGGVGDTIFTGGFSNVKNIDYPERKKLSRTAKKGEHK